MIKRPSPTPFVLAALLAASLAAAPAGATAQDATTTSKVLEAKIVRTDLGIPHITAPDIKALAAGYAYAFAEDNICTIAAEYVTTAGQRSRFFGPDETWTFSGNGISYDNIDADTYFQWVKQTGAVEDLIKQQAPIGPKPGVRRGVTGYVAGYNAYLREVGAENIPDPTCAGEPWVRKIREIDVYRRFYQLGILASSGAVISGIVDSEPISLAAAEAGDAERDRMLESGEGLEALQPQLGSNAYGFGKETTTNGKGLVLGNPHFPWDGSARLYQSQLRIPGRLNVQGGSLYGVPLINIGNTKGLAWSHTVATAWRFTPFKLTLPPGDPYSYIVDGEVRPMRAEEVTVRALQADGSLADRTRTIYSTEYGPMISDLVGIPLPWTEGTGFALKDVNATNFRYLNHFFDNNKAQTVREYDRIQEKYQGIPWVNSIAADSKGESYYSMQGAVPNVPDELAARCNVLQPVYEVLGLPVLDGARSSCDWAESPDAVAPGTFPPGKLPTQFRDDYVHNGNDSHWLTNPEAPLTGFDRIIGIEEAERTYRTRIGLVQIEDRLAGADGLPGNRFDRESLEQVTLSNRNYLGELWRDDLVGFCRSVPGGTLLGSSGPVPLGDACDVLADWDLRDDLGSAGVLLFRRFAVNLLGNFRSLPTGLQGGISLGAQSLFTTQYNPADPIHTPSGLLTLNPLVGQALADGIADLDEAGIPLDAGLRGFQTDERGGEAISIPGGPGGLGVFNVITANWRPQEGGYTNIAHGSSFMMAAHFVDGRCPVDVGTFVTYSQSENPESPHAADYTKRFAQERWHDMPFCPSDVKRETVSTDKLRIRAPR